MTNLVLITGGSSGIGAGIVQRCLADGYEVVVVDRMPPASNISVKYIEADLSDAASTRHALAQALESGPITRVVNNVGTALPASLENSRAEELSVMVNLNLACTVEVMKALLTGMKTARFGRVVNISSRSALGRPNMGLYAATKAGVNGLTRSWALEFATQGITVNGVGPGVIDTDLLAKTFPPGSGKRADLERSIPMARVGETADIASAVSFFLRDETRYVTGQILYVCGGTSIMAAI